MTNYKAPKRRTIDERWYPKDIYPCRRQLLNPEIERAVVSLYPTQPFATHGSACADLLLHALQDKPQAAAAPASWRDAIISQVLERWTETMVGRVLVYSHNVNGRRVPKDQQAQRQAFRRNLFATYPLAVTALAKIQQPGDPTSQSERTVGKPESIGVDPGLLSDPFAGPPPGFEPEPEPEPTPRCSVCDRPLTSAEQMSTVLTGNKCQHCTDKQLGNIVIGSTDPLRAHHEWSVGVREIMLDRELSWSMRPTIDGIALIGAGCPPEAVRDACLMDYPDDLRDQLGVGQPYDFAKFGTVDYLLKAASARVDDRGKLRPVCLAMVGPAGTGKTTLATILAEKLDMQRYDVSMSGGTPMSAFYGIDRLNADLTMSDFERWATDGGIHLFDEMDCSDPNLLKIVNKALANRDYTNPLSGKRIELSPDAIAIAGMNTLGGGIQTEYSAAEQLDFSTIDRFRAGRVRVQIDETLETTIVEAQIASLRA